MKIGIRKEDKNIWEKRTPLTPPHVRTLVEGGLEVVVEPSEQRAFTDAAFSAAGAKVQAGLEDCPVVMAVKEIPTRLLAPGRTYVYFAHVIKGQPHNMPMLRRILDLEATLIDYEKVVDQDGRRLIFFGRHAGLAGMLDSLWALGQRLKAEGHVTPLAGIRMAHSYPGLEAAEQAVREAGEAIAADGLPLELGPVVIGFAGYGNVSQGAQHIADLLPHRVIEPVDLPKTLAHPSPRELYKVVFKEEHMVQPIEAGRTFDLQEYYQHPERYRGVFAKHVPYLTVLVNCIYWTEAYPRLVTCGLLKDLFVKGEQPRLRVIGDISIDIEGAIECSRKATDPGDPVYVYLPAEDRIEDGVEGAGPVVLAVDNLPCELPVEASGDFGDALLPYVEAIAQADYSQPFDRLDLPDPIKGAVIAHRGKLAPGYEYLREHLAAAAGGERGGQT